MPIGVIVFYVWDVPLVTELQAALCLFDVRPVASVTFDFVDGRLTPETCRGLRHNKVFAIVKVKVY
jgi:hypothetical protein